MICICLLLITTGYGQDAAQQLGGTTPDKKMGSGNNTINIMGGIFSPSLYDGTANINIPIFQYKVDEVDYGISLTYNTRGVKVSQLAGQIGLNWNLAVGGGTIQRVVKDIPDDVYSRNIDEIIEGNYTMLNPEKKFKGRLIVYGESPEQAGEDSVYRDHESDDYMVSIGSLNFTFNLGKNGYVFTNPQNEVKVEMLYNNIPVTSLPSVDTLATPEFRITDEHGNRYYFVKGDLITENIEDKYGNRQYVGSYTYARSWVIKKVITYSGAEINYFYSSAYHRISFKQVSDIQPEPYGPGSSPFNNDPTLFARLDSINYPTGVMVVMKYDDLPALDDYSGALRRIELKKSAGSTQLTYRMKQSYLVATGLTYLEPKHNDSAEIVYQVGTIGERENYRLKLNGLTIQGQSGPEEPYYNFEYSSVRLPKRFNGSQDYFGFYNGKTPVPFSSGPSPELSIPLHRRFIPGYIIPFYYGVDRTPDINYMKAASLTKIKNAYGGQIEFLYDAHVLEAVLNSSNIPGYPDADSTFMGRTEYDGLRLQAIIERDNIHTTNYRKTTFTYSGGQLFINGGYFHYQYQYHDGTDSVKKIIMTNQFVSRHQLINGANHGYSFISVKQTDEFNTQLSRTVYGFTNFKDENNQPRYQRVGSGSKYFFQFPFSDKQLLRDWEMGLLVSTKEYDQNDNIITERTNTYKTSIDSTASFNKIENTRITEVKTDFVPSVVQTLPHTLIFTDTYRPFRGKAQLVSCLTKTYVSDNSFLIDEIVYKYSEAHDNLISTLTSNSKGEYYKTENIYNYDLSTLSGSQLQNYTDAGLQKLVSTQRWKTDSTGLPHFKLIEGVINTFEYSNQRVYPKRTYIVTPGVPATRNQYSGYSGSGPIPNPHHKIIEAFQGAVPEYFLLASEMVLSDSKGNPLESRVGEHGQYKAMIWDDVTGKKLAEAANCRYANIAYCGFETPAVDTVTKGNVTYHAGFVVPATIYGNLHGAALSLTSVSGGVRGSQPLIGGKEYMLSFWTTGSGLPTVYSGNTLLNLPDPSQEYNNFKYFNIRFTASMGDKFNIQWPGPGAIYIDEIRLQPVNTQMQSWNYTPMFGPASTTDANGRMTFTEYDGQGRPKIVRNKDGNILSKTEYGIQ